VCQLTRITCSHQCPSQSDVIRTEITHDGVIRTCGKWPKRFKHSSKERSRRVDSKYFKMAKRELEGVQDGKVQKKKRKKKKLDSQGFDPRTSRMLSGRATKCTTNPFGCDDPKKQGLVVQ
jgi:hypothetical protein